MFSEIFSDYIVGQFANSELILNFTRKYAFNIIKIMAASRKYLKVVPFCEKSDPPCGLEKLPNMQISVSQSAFYTQSAVYILYLHVVCILY